MTLVRAQLPEWLHGTVAGAAPGAAARGFDLALCDPPYDFDDWPALLEALPAPRIVMESSAPIALPEGWMSIRERRYGGTLVTVAQHSGIAS